MFYQYLELPVAPRYHFRMEFDRLVVQSFKGSVAVRLDFDWFIFLQEVESVSCANLAIFIDDSCAFKASTNRWRLLRKFVDVGCCNSASTSFYTVSSYNTEDGFAHKWSNNILSLGWSCLFEIYLDGEEDRDRINYCSSTLYSTYFLYRF